MAESLTPDKTFELNRTLTRKFHSDKPAIEKLWGVVVEIKSQLQLCYTAVTVISSNMWLQTTLTAKNETKPALPTPACTIDTYSVAHQVQQIVEDDPCSLPIQYSIDDDPPNDIRALSEAKGLTNFMVHGICSPAGALVGYITFGHTSKEPFEDMNEWTKLCATLDIILYTLVHSARILQFLEFTEIVRMTRSRADLTVIVSAYVPDLVLGDCKFLVRAFMGIVGQDGRRMKLYKTMADPEKATHDHNISSLRRAELSRSLRNVRRVSSNPQYLSVGTFDRAAGSSPVSKPRMSPTIPRARKGPPVLRQNKPRNSADRALQMLNDGTVVICSRVRLSRTFMHTAVTSASTVFVEDVMHHLMETPDGHSELIGSEGDMPHRLILFPIHSGDGQVVGGMYLVSPSPIPFSMVVAHMETLLVISSPDLLAGMRARNGMSSWENVPLELTRGLLPQQLSRTRTTMQYSNDADDMRTLQTLFLGMIDKQSISVPQPQICQPEHIRLESLIGIGTFGVVYKGRIDMLNTMVAVKVVALHPVMDDVRIRGIAMELASLSKAKHRNVVEIIAHFPDCVSLLNNDDINGPCFRATQPEDLSGEKADSLPRCCLIVMEYCVYGTLLSAVQKDIFKHHDGSPDVGSICFVLTEIASALAHIHANRIIHCDLKPQNVLLKADDCDPRGFVIKLADFGLARVVSKDLPMLSGDSAGTPSHIAPEIIKTKDGDSIKTPKADIYAFGVLMWELYNSQQAFASYDQNEVLMLVIKGRRLAFPPGAEPRYVALCQRCWAANMDDRPSLQVIQQELHSITRNYLASIRGGAAAPGSATVKASAAPPAAALPLARAKVISQPPMPCHAMEASGAPPARSRLSQPPPPGGLAPGAQGGVLVQPGAHRGLQGGVQVQPGDAYHAGQRGPEGVAVAGLHDLMIAARLAAATDKAFVGQKNSPHKTHP